MSNIRRQGTMSTKEQRKFKRFYFCYLFGHKRNDGHEHELNNLIIYIALFRFENIQSIKVYAGATWIIYLTGG